MLELPCGALALRSHPAYTRGGVQGDADYFNPLDILSSMNFKGLPGGIIDWSEIPESVHAGVSGAASVRAKALGDAQIRHVVYSRDYVSDHWCQKGHIVFCVAGEFVIEHQNGIRYTLHPGTSCLLAENDGSPHRGVSENGATVFIVD